MRRSMYEPEVLRGAADWVGVSVEDMLGPRKFKELVKARRIASVALRIIGYSYPEIASLMDRDHTSIMNLVNRASDDVWQASEEIVERARQRTFTLLFKPQMGFIDSWEWQVINRRTGTTVSLPPGLSEDLSAALKAGGMDE